MPALDTTLSRSLSESTASLRFVARMNGSAQSMLVRNAENELWVLKPCTNLQGPNALANEFIGAELCKALGLPIPHYQIITLDKIFCSDHRVNINTPSGPLPIEPGLHFASRYLPDSSGQELLEMSPSISYASIRNKSDCLGMFMFDIWAMHADNRQALFAVHADGLDATFFDNSHLFGGPAGTLTDVFLNGRVLQGTALDRYRNSDQKEYWLSLMEDTLPRALYQALSATPPIWFEGDLSHLALVLLDRLQSLRYLVDTAFTRLALHIERMNVRCPVTPNAEGRFLSRAGDVYWR